MQVIMLADVFGADRTLLANGSAQDLAEAVALDLIGTGRARWASDPVPTPTPSEGRVLATPAQVAASVPFVTAGALLADPITGLIYGQSDGNGGYQALGGGSAYFPIADEAAMLALYPASAGLQIHRLDTNTNWQIDSDAAADDDSPERLARWRNLGAIITPPIAATNVTIADSGGHYTGTDAETVLDEVGDRLDVLEDPPLADLWPYLLGLVDSTTVSPWGYSGGQFATTTLSVAGITASTLAGSTAAIANFADTNVATRSPHVQHDSATSASGVCGVRSTQVGIISTTAGRGGAYVRFRVAARDAASVTDAGCFYGIRVTSSEFAAGTDYDSLTSCVGFGVPSSGGSDLVLMHNDASGSITTVALAENWPAHDNTEAYEFTLNNPPGTRDWEWTATRLSTGVTLSGTLLSAGSELPAADNVCFLYLMRRNGATALAVSLAYYYMVRGRLNLPALAAAIGGGGSIDLSNPDPWTVTQGVTAVNLGNITGTVTLLPRSQSNTCYAVLTGNVTFAVPTAGRSGDKITLYLKQDATGSRTITMNASIKPLIGGTTLLASTLASTVDVLMLEWVDHDAGWRYSFVNGTV